MGNVSSGDKTTRVALGNAANMEVYLHPPPRRVCLAKLLLSALYSYAMARVLYNSVLVEEAICAKASMTASSPSRPFMPVRKEKKNFPAGGCLRGALP